MRLPDRVRALFGALFGRNRLDRRIEEEIAFHIEARTRSLTASGLHPDEAARRARAEFGGSVQVREECREARGAWISRIADHVFRDVRFTLRTFRRSPGTLSVAVLTLSLGVAATTAMYSAVDGVLLEPLPYPDPDRMVWVWSVETDTGMRVRASFPDFSDWRRDGTTLDLAGWGGYSPILTGAGNPERLTAALVMGDFFELLGVRPALGVFEELDTIRDEEPSVVLSHGIWEERFGSDPGIVGQPMTLDDTAYIVAGVMPADFRFPIHARPEVDIWVPLARFNPVLANQRGARLIEVIGRIRPGASLEAARSEMVAIAVGLSETFPDTNRGIGIELVPAIDEVTGGVSRGLWILFAASTGLLLIACVNVANILLARASGREREFRIRGALGAGRARVSLQLVVEGILISVGGGFMACLLAYGSIDVLAALIPVEVPRADRIALDARVLTFALAASLATGLSFSMAPVLQVWRRAGAPRARRDHGEHRMRAALIVSETALATILLTASGLLVQTFVRLNQSDTGFAPANVLTFEVDLPSGRYPRPAEAFRDLQSRLMDIPGVVVASTGLQLPDRGIPMIDDVAPAMIEVDATPLPEAERRRVSVLSTQPGYFRALGVPLLAGRDFWAGDSSDAPRVAIINESLAATYFAAQDPIGRRITLDSWTLSGERSARVVGVSGNVAHRSLTAPVQGYVYLPLEQRPQWYLPMVVRTEGDPASFVPAVREAVGRFDPAQPIFDVQPLETRIADSIAVERFRAYWIGGFSAIALILVSVGLYGVLARLTALRVKEVGIRIALGAESRQVWTMVLGQGLKWTAAGAGIGLAVSIVAARYLESLLFGIGWSDPLTFGLVPVVLGLVSAIACSVPARRASRIEPADALRSE